MTARRAVVVVNPTARKGAAGALVPSVQRALRDTGWRCDTVVTTSARHAVDAASEADPDDLLVALGGDGLVGRVAQGALVSGAAIAPLPAGRGFDFVRALDAPRDAELAARGLATAQERLVDVGMAGDLPFLGVATIGYDSLANAHANRAPRVVPSRLVYVYGGARALLQTTPTRIELRVDGVDCSFTGWNVAIGNTGRFGAGMKVNPDASYDDGLLDVTIVGDLARWRYPAMLPRLFRGTHVDGTRIRSFRGSRITVSAPQGWAVFADGDRAGETPMQFTVRPGVLRVLAARSQSHS